MLHYLATNTASFKFCSLFLYYDGFLYCGVIGVPLVLANLGTELCPIIFVTDEKPVQVIFGVHLTGPNFMELLKRKVLLRM